MRLIIAIPRSEVIAAAVQASAEGDHETARALFRAIGIDYVTAAEIASGADSARICRESDCSCGYVDQWSFELPEGVN